MLSANQNWKTSAKSKPASSSVTKPKPVLNGSKQPVFEQYLIIQSNGASQRRYNFDSSEGGYRGL